MAIFRVALARAPENLNEFRFSISAETYTYIPVTAPLGSYPNFLLAIEEKLRPHQGALFLVDGEILAYDQLIVWLGNQGTSDSKRCHPLHATGSAT